MSAPNAVRVITPPFGRLHDRDEPVQVRPSAWTMPAGAFAEGYGPNWTKTKTAFPPPRATHGRSSGRMTIHPWRR
jgi:hypothetical protein